MRTASWLASQDWLVGCKAMGAGLRGMVRAWAGVQGGTGFRPGRTGGPAAPAVMTCE